MAPLHALEDNSKPQPLLVAGFRIAETHRLRKYLCDALRAADQVDRAIVADRVLRHPLLSECVDVSTMVVPPAACIAASPREPSFSDPESTTPIMRVPACAATDLKSKSTVDHRNGGQDRRLVPETIGHQCQMLRRFADIDGACFKALALSSDDHGKSGNSSQDGLQLSGPVPLAMEHNHDDGRQSGR